MWSTSRPALQQCGQREKEKRGSHCEIEELIAFPFGRTWHFLARCRGAVSCLSCFELLHGVVLWGGEKTFITTRCIVQESMILDSQHASTIVAAATEPEQFILGTAEKSIGSAVSGYECVNVLIEMRSHAEKCHENCSSLCFLCKGVLAKCKPLASKMCPLSWTGTLR